MFLLWFEIRNSAERRKAHLLELLELAPLGTKCVDAYDVTMGARAGSAL